LLAEFAMASALIAMDPDALARIPILGGILDVPHLWCFHEKVGRRQVKNLVLNCF
jgi:hypothetical protein